uniref:Uncharacterized protein n=1 Tax=Lepeophtheirus salmonis TaxID=72036 RepID=A0A0K2TRJ5_LEPSM
MIQLSDFLVVWQSVFTGLSLLANIGSLTSLLLKRNSPRLFKAYLLILLLQLSHISLVKVPLVYTLWWSSGSYPFGPQLCTASCIIDFALPSAILVFTTCLLLHISLLNRLPRNAIIFSLGLGLLAGAFIGLQACIRDSSRTTCFGYFAQKKEARKYSDWIVSIGTNGFSIISVIFAGTLSFFRGSPYWDKVTRTHTYSKENSLLFLRFKLHNTCILNTFLMKEKVRNLISYLSILSGSSPICNKISPLAFWPFVRLHL